MPGNHAQALAHTPRSALSRFEDRISFVHIDRAAVTRGSTGVVALLTREGSPIRVPIPVAALAVVSLGPGTRISSQALASITRAGAVVQIVSGAGTRTHCWAYEGTRTARWAQAQATLWADMTTRIEVAEQMYLRRFTEPVVGKVTLERLRGLEGRRMKMLYKQLASSYKIPNWRRRYDPSDFEAGDPVNQALSSANACLYGVALAGITGIGAAPQLGFVHGGHVHSFVHDIADLYKAETSIPVAFSLAKSEHPADDARRRMRAVFTKTRLLKRVVSDIQELLTPGLSAEYASENRLLDDSGTVEGGRDWSRIVGDNDLPNIDVESEEVWWVSDIIDGTTEPVGTEI